MRVLLAVIALVACAKTSTALPPPDPNEIKDRAMQAEKELRRLGAGRFEVVSFSAEPERLVTFSDDFEYPTTQHHVPFRAKVRLSVPLTVLRDGELMDQQKLPGWKPEDTRAGYVLLLLMGPGQFAAGSELDLSAAAAFDDLEPGYRFRIFDKRR